MLITDRKLVTVSGESTGQRLPQAIKVNITDTVSLLIGDAEDTVSLLKPFLSQMLNQNPIMRKYLTNSDGGTFFKTTGLNEPFKNVHVVKDKGKLRNCCRLKIYDDLIAAL